MAYRQRINLSDPRLQTAAVQAAKGNAAVPSARQRGLYSNFGASEGSRLQRGEIAGRQLASRKRQLEFERKMGKRHYKLDKKGAKIRRKMFEDEKLGNKIALGIGIGQLGLGAYDMAKQKRADMKQARWQDYMYKTKGGTRDWRDLAQVYRGKPGR